MPTLAFRKKIKTYLLIIFFTIFYIIINFPIGAPTVQPETQVTGGCMEGWYPYKNRCFQYHGFQQHEVEDRKNFDDASLECQKTTGATLAVIPDKMYNSFVYAHMYGSASGNGFFHV